MDGTLRDDAQLARDVMIALTQELTREQNIELAKAYARVFVVQGMVVDFSVHDKLDGNPHAHYIMTMRDISEDGFSKKKNGNLDRNDYVIGQRKSYHDIKNRYLEMNAFEEMICVDSYEKHGIDKIPTIHLGCAAQHMKQRGIHSDRGDINREIGKDNREIENIDIEIANLKSEKEWQDEPFHHDRAAEYSRKYNVQDSIVAHRCMGAEEEQIEIGEPLSDRPVQDLIEHYTRVLEDERRLLKHKGLF